jgi:FAD/FMN-containing dehydrogenase
MNVDQLAARLASIVGDTHVLLETEQTAPYEVDWTGRWQGEARLVVQPGSADEVSRIVVACAAIGAPIVPQGGNTGLVGGSVPVGVAGAVVVSLRRLAWLGPVDAVAGQVVVGAGATLAEIQRHVRGAGWDLGIDLAARDSATIGGAVASNAGGTRALRYGSARVQVAEVEAVLADGRILSRNPAVAPAAGSRSLASDSTGYDLPGLFAGSEGTLGILTAVRLRLVPLPPVRAVALVGVGGVAEAQRVLDLARQRLPDLTAAEIVDAAGIALVREHAALAAPFDAEHPSYLFLECAGRDEGLAAALTAALDGVPEALGVAVAPNGAGRTRLWRYREAVSEAVRAAGTPVILDVVVPPAALPDVESSLREAVRGAAPDSRTILCGHLAAAAFQVNILDAIPVADEVTGAVLQVVAERCGSIAAEHGVGRAKPRWLGLSRSPVEIATMRALKSALDPAGLLNPGVLLPAVG